MGKSIRLENIVKKYDQQIILKNINLSITAGEKIVLLGPSGSGKSTLLRMIAGLETITSGKLYLDETISNQLACGERDMAMVFQNYALYPHMTVTQNIVFGLSANKVNKEEIARRLNEALTILELLPYKDRLPKQLSGGQRQRVALARAVVKRSDYFLLDEPLSNLDVRLRLEARKELVNIHNTYKQTMVYVTHDQVEAMTIADRIVLLHNGVVQMFDTPKNIYERPSNVFTASFIGSPPMNILPIIYEKNCVMIQSQSIVLENYWSAYLNEKIQKEKHFLGIRPEHLQLTNDTTHLKGIIQYKELLGQYYSIVVDLAGNDVTVLSETDEWCIGDTVYIEVAQQHMHFFDGDTEKNLGYPQSFRSSL